jgi:Family of unknown function (DUF6518)
MGVASSRVFANAPVGEPGAELDPAGPTSGTPAATSRVNTAERRRTPGIVLPAALVTALVLGTAVGVFTSDLQAHLNGSWDSLANAISPWLAPAFAVGAMTRRPTQAAIVGVVVCLGEVGGYYATAAEHGHPASLAPVLFWACGALVGGQLFGMAGWMWRSAAGWYQGLGIALLSAAFFAEAANYVQALDQDGSALLFTAIGVALIAVLGFHKHQHARTFLWLIAALPCGASGELIVALALNRVLL